MIAHIFGPNIQGIVTPSVQKKFKHVKVHLHQRSMNFLTLNFFLILWPMGQMTKQEKV